MTKSMGLLLGCVGLLAASVVAGWSDAHAIAAANATMAELDHRIDAAEQRSRQVTARIAAARKESEQLERSLAKLTAARPSAAAERPPASSRTAIEWAKRWEKQLEDPKVQNENLKFAQARLHDLFAPMYRALHLTPQQIAAFEETEAAYNARQSDLNAALLKQRISVLDPVAVGLFSKLADDELASEKQVLGDAGYAGFVDFLRTSNVRAIVSRFVGAMTVMGEPLNGTQSEQLVRAIAESDPKYVAGGRAGTDVDWDRALMAAQPILSAAQMEVLQNFEPPGGGRFWAKLNAVASAAAKSDALTRGGTPPGQ